MTGLLLALSALMIGFVPAHAPLMLIPVLSLTLRPWYGAWIFTRGTALRPVLVWVALALVMSTLAQSAALAEPISSGRPWTGRLTYLAVLAALAALTSVLNARAPGGRVWAGLMVVLVVVFLIPWLEGPWRLRRAHGLELLHLDAPWTIFYGFLVLVGVTNYLPTRFGASASWLALGFILEYLGLTRNEWPVERRAALWSWVAWTLAASVSAAHSGNPPCTGGPHAARATLVLVPRPLGRRLGHPHPGPIQSHRRAEGLAHSPELVRAGPGRSRFGRRASRDRGSFRGGGHLPGPDPALRPGRAT